jgi:hypothetical protein
VHGSYSSSFTSPLYGKPSVSFFGLDWLMLTFPLAGPPEDPSALSRRSHRRWPGIVRVGGTKAELAVRLRRGGYWARIDFNPARALDPTGWEPCSVFDTHRAAAMAWEAALDHVSPAEFLDTARVRRLDVTRDFEVEDPSFFVRSLAPIPRPYARINATYRAPSSGTPATLMLGSRSGGVCKLYAKSETVLRFEATCRKGWLGRAAIRYLADVTEDHVDVLGRDRWAWSRFGTWIGSPATVIDAALRMPWRRARQERAVGTLAIRAHTGEAPRPSATDSRLEADLRALGGAFATSTADEWRPELVRLDLEAGTEVTARTSDTPTKEETNAT